MPTPLYPVYRREFGFSEFIVTAIYASYVIGNLSALFALGRVSDQLGRRPTTLVAFGVLFASILCFLASTGTAWLFIARVLNGLAAGLGAGALTAWIAELEPGHDKARAAIVASTGNLAGLALGAIMAGLLAQYAPWPLRTSYVVYLALLLLVVVMTLAVPEGVKHTVRSAKKMIEWVCKDWPMFARDLPFRKVVDEGRFTSYSHDCKQTISANRWAMAAAR